MRHTPRPHPIDWQRLRTELFYAFGLVMIGCGISLALLIASLFIVTLVSR